MLTALFAFGVGTTQCEDTFADKSLEELKGTLVSDFNEIKQVPEYKIAEALYESRVIIQSFFDTNHARCESFKKSGANWFLSISEDNCKRAQEFEQLLAMSTGSSIIANNALEAVIAKNHPTYNQVFLAILEKQKTADLLNKPAQ